VKAWSGRKLTASVSFRFVDVTMKPSVDWLAYSRRARATLYVVCGSTICSR
jgi:hypothetical protein